MITLNKAKLEDFVSHAAAMVVGDFLGCFIVIMFFNVCIDVAFKLMDGERRADQSGVRRIAYLFNKKRS